LNARGEVNWLLTWVARTVFCLLVIGRGAFFGGAFLKVTLHSTTTPHLPTRSSRI
jgi:hypothetical protein